jgi:ATP-dependent Zn protease
MHFAHEEATERWRAERDRIEAERDRIDREQAQRDQEAWRTARRKFCARHESAHAIVALLRGGDVTEVAITESDKGIGGHCRIANIHAVDHLVSVCAGEVADGTAENWLPARCRRDEEMSHDRAVAHITAARLAGDDFERGGILLDEARVTAARMVAENVEAIDYLAGMLLRHRKLNGAVVRAVAQKYGLFKTPAARPRSDVLHLEPRALPSRSISRDQLYRHDRYIGDEAVRHRAMLCDRDLSAIHESAHAVAFWAYGIDIKGVWLTDAGGGWTRVSCDEREQSSFERVVALAAGEIAEEELLGHVETRNHPDREKAMKIARQINAEMAPAVLDCARRQARRLVRANAEAIKMLAAALIERGELDGRTIAMLLLNHQGRWRRAA